MQRVVFAGLLLIATALLNMANAAPAGKLSEVLQKGYAECKSAHVLRRKDLALSKQTYSGYLAIRDQIMSLDPNFLASEDPEITRVVSYCDTVGNDIARTEALPVIQQGVIACGEASESLQAGNLAAARKALASYDELKDRAVEISPVVLEVYAVKSGVRRCERVAQEIETRFAQQQAVNAQKDEVTGYLDTVLESCTAIEVPDTEIIVTEVEDLAAEVSSLTAAIRSLKAQLAGSRQALAELPGQEFLANEAVAYPDFLLAVADKVQNIEACQVELSAAFERADATVIALQDEQTRREEAAAASAEELVEQEETPEQRRERLENNALSYTLVKRVPPKYPASALRAEREGYVLIEYTIGVNGDVIDPVVIESEGGKSFNKAALNAVKQWEYQSSFAEGVTPEVALMRSQIKFTLQ